MSSMHVNHTGSSAYILCSGPINPCSALKFELQMARLHRTPLGAPAISLLLLIMAALASVSEAADPPPKKAGMRLRYADKEEARWLDRYAETHQPLGARPLTVVPATEEESYWLNRMSDNTARRAGDQSDDGEDGGGGNYIEFDEDNPYVHALQAWASRLLKQGLEKARAEDAENPFQDL